MKIEVECHKCKKEFIAEQDEEGYCPYCNNKYDWFLDGELWSDTESCCIIFETESEEIKKHFLISRNWI